MLVQAVWTGELSGHMCVPSMYLKFNTDISNVSYSILKVTVIYTYNLQQQSDDSAAEGPWKVSMLLLFPDIEQEHDNTTGLVAHCHDSGPCRVNSD